jgi:hypothetical protein
VGIAEVHHAHAELYIDNSGRCFGHSVVDGGFYFEGESFGEVIERLLRGRRSWPILRPEQNMVRHYGNEIRADDPTSVRYRKKSDIASNSTLTQSLR